MAEKIDAIKEELTATPTEALEAFVEKYASDSRKRLQCRNWWIPQKNAWISYRRK